MSIATGISLAWEVYQHNIWRKLLFCVCARLSPLICDTLSLLTVILPLDLWSPILAQWHSSSLWTCVCCTFMYKILNWNESCVTRQYSGDPVYTNWIWHSETWTSLTRQIHIVQILSRLVLPVYITYHIHIRFRWVCFLHVEWDVVVNQMNNVIDALSRRQVFITFNTPMGSTPDVPSLIRGWDT